LGGVGKREVDAGSGVAGETASRNRPARAAVRLGYALLGAGTDAMHWAQPYRGPEARRLLATEGARHQNGVPAARAKAGRDGG